MKKIALALVALTVATPAFAQASSEDAPTFTGGYVGAVAGYDQLDLNTAGVDNPSGLVYGIDAGYDVQLGKAVLGIEAEAADSTAKIKVSGTTIASAERDLYIGGRVGFVAGKALIYGKAGYTNARVDTIAGSDNGDGFRLGAGAEFRVGRNLSLKAEYRYSNYEADVERNQVVAGVAFRF